MIGTGDVVLGRWKAEVEQILVTAAAVLGSLRAESPFGASGAQRSSRSFHADRTAQSSAAWCLKRQSLQGSRSELAQHSEHRSEVQRKENTVPLGSGRIGPRASPNVHGRSELIVTSPSQNYIIFSVFLSVIYED